jgi:hypothetical protein
MNIPNLPSLHHLKSGEAPSGDAAAADWRKRIGKRSAGARSFKSFMP